MPVSRQDLIKWMGSGGGSGSWNVQPESRSIGIQPGRKPYKRKPFMWYPQPQELAEWMNQTRGGSQMPTRRMPTRYMIGPGTRGLPPTGMSQEPLSPWGVAIHDPLERQRVQMTPSGIPVLKPWGQYGYNYGRGARQTAAASGGSSGSGGWGGYGGGGGGGWTGAPQAALPRWWDPGLMNWRYGVTY